MITERDTKTVWEIWTYFRKIPNVMQVAATNNENKGYFLLALHEQFICTSGTQKVLKSNKNRGVSHSTSTGKHCCSESMGHMPWKLFEKQWFFIKNLNRNLMNFHLKKIFNVFNLFTLTPDCILLLPFLFVRPSVTYSLLHWAFELLTFLTTTHNTAHLSDSPVSPQDRQMVNSQSWKPADSCQPDPE